MNSDQPKCDCDEPTCPRWCAGHGKRIGIDAHASLETEAVSVGRFLNAMFPIEWSPPMRNEAWHQGVAEPSLLAVEHERVRKLASEIARLRQALIDLDERMAEYDPEVTGSGWSGIPALRRMVDTALGRTVIR